jgi:hypothetical protein
VQLHALAVAHGKQRDFTARRLAQRLALLAGFDAVVERVSKCVHQGILQHAAPLRVEQSAIVHPVELRHRFAELARE